MAKPVQRKIVPLDLEAWEHQAVQDVLKVTLSVRLSSLELIKWVWVLMCCCVERGCREERV